MSDDTSMSRGYWWNWTRLMQLALLAAAVVLWALHLLHLRADFPNGSPWNDWAKYTDEGWYGDAAIRHYLRGSWLLPGDFNPGVALPVWPLLEAVVFRFTGVGIVAARALAVCVFGGILAASYVLLRQLVARRQFRLGGGIAAVAVVLLAVNPFLYAFTRMAIVEPLLVLLTLLALIAGERVATAKTSLGVCVWAAMAGLFVALMIGTKTTAVVLVPAVAWQMASASGWSWRRSLRPSAIAAVCAVFPWALYMYFLHAHGYVADFRYLFSANAYTAVTHATFWPVLHQALHNGLWIGPLLYPLAVLAMVVGMLQRRLWRDGLFVSLLLWVMGYFVFLVYHANQQPRYYLVVAVPLVLMLARVCMHGVERGGVLLFALVPIALMVFVFDLQETLRYVRHPDYSFAAAAARIDAIVEGEPKHSHTVLSISGSNLSLMTGLPSIDDDFGTMQLEDRIATYKPGWFVAWNYVEDDKMEALAKFYRLTRVAELPTMDDPERNVMIVYRLDAK